MRLLRILLNCELALVAIAYLLKPLAAVEPRRWPVELKFGRFEIHSDFDVSEQQALLSELSALSDDVQAVLGLQNSQRPVHVVLFETGHEYRRYMQNYFPNLPERRALFLQDRGPGMLFAHWHAEIASDLRHETAHALLNECAYPLPLWLDEGLAEYFEVSRELRFRGNPYLHEIARQAELGVIPSLEYLESVTDLQEFTDFHYRDSWAWSHFLLHRSAATRELLVRFLDEHRSGASQLALGRQMTAILQDRNAEYQAHFRLMQETLIGKAKQESP